MDFIERIFGISPDNGDGSLELLWIVAIVAVLLVFAFRHRVAAALSRRRPRRN